MKKILIIDDNKDIVDLVVNRLRMNNYDVIFANDGEDGIKKALEEFPHLIILDLMMPEIPGGEVVKFLRTNELTKTIPILFFTATTTFLIKGIEPPQIKIEGQLYLVVTKPFDPKKLLFAIKSLLGE